MLGIAGGIWFGKMLGAIYMEVYRFPYLIYTLHPGVIIAAVLITYRFSPCRHPAFSLAGSQAAACRGHAARSPRQSTGCL